MKSVGATRAVAALKVAVKFLGLLALAIIVITEDRKTPAERKALSDRYSRAAQCAPDKQACLPALLWQ